MEFKNEYVYCKVQFLDNNQYVKLTGNIKSMSNYKNVTIMAPQTINKTSSYSGTGLPFPCADIAFEETSNVYMVPKHGAFDTTFTYPNSYYSIDKKKKIISSVFFVFENQNDEQEFVRLELKDLYPLRTLVNREARQGPEFYSAKYERLPNDTAEIIMREYARIKEVHNLA